MVPCHVFVVHEDHVLLMFTILKGVHFFERDSHGSNNNNYNNNGYCCYCYCNYYSYYSLVGKDLIWANIHSC